MASIYINPGFGELLGDVSERFTTIESNVYSNTGVSFIYSVINNTECEFTIPFTSSSGNYYLRFDWHEHGYSLQNFHVKLPLAEGTLDFYTNTQNFLINIPSKESKYDSKSIFNVEKDKVNTAWLCLNITSSSPGFRYAVNGIYSEIFDLSGYSKGYGNPVLQFPHSTQYTPESANKICLSNIIVSDIELSVDETAIIVPTTIESNDMTSAENGKYLLDKVGASLKVAVNKAQFLDICSGDTLVHGVTIAGVPFEMTSFGTITLGTFVTYPNGMGIGGYFNLTSTNMGFADNRAHNDDVPASDFQNWKFSWNVSAINK